MAKFNVEVLSLITTSEDSEAPAFEAVGLIDGASFKAQTILWGPKGTRNPFSRWLKVRRLLNLSPTLASPAVSGLQLLGPVRWSALARLS